MAFGPSTFTVTDPDGNVVDQGSDPGATKGSANPAGRTLLNCNYSFSLTIENGLTLSGSGTVTGFITGKK